MQGANCEAQSLLLFTINFHNFTFSLAARGSDEGRTTAGGLETNTEDKESNHSMKMEIYAELKFA